MLKLFGNPPAHPNKLLPMPLNNWPRHSCLTDRDKRNCTQEDGSSEWVCISLCDAWVFVRASFLHTQYYTAEIRLQ